MNVKLSGKPNSIHRFREDVVQEIGVFVIIPLTLDLNIDYFDFAFEFFPDRSLDRRSSQPPPSEPNTSL